MSTTIESLELEIKSNSTGAKSGIDTLIASLNTLKTATKGGLGLRAISKQVRSISDSANSIQSSSISNLNGLANAIQLLGSIKVNSNIGKSIASITTALNGLKIENSGNVMKIQELVTALQPLSQMPKQNISQFVTQLKNIPKVFAELDKVDMNAFKTKISELADAMKPLATEMEKVAAGFSAFPTRIQQFITGMNNVPNSNNKAALSFTDLYHKIKSAYQMLSRGIKIIGGFIGKSSDYIENLHLFDVAMGSYASSAKGYAEEVSEVLGIDPGEWMYNQGLFQTLITGFGVAGDSASKMSKNLTQLAYDLSSFYNIDVETAMLKLKSGMAGELEPLRAIGYDLSQAKLEATAAELGIDKAVSSMTQAEKAMLRYHAIMTQVDFTHGDMAETIREPANQLRILKAQLEMLGREIGNVFMPLLREILPNMIAIVKVTREIVSTIGMLVGVEITDVGEAVAEMATGSENTATALENASDEAKKLKSYMLGIDELNVINPNNNEETSTDAFDIDIPEYNFLENAANSIVGDIVEKMKEWLGVSKDIKSWSDLLDTRFGTILKTVGLIGATLLGWKIAKGVTDTIDAIKNLSVGKLKALKITIGAVLAIEGIIIAADAIEEAITEGLNGVNMTEILMGSGLFIGGAALLGSAFGKTFTVAAIGSIIAGIVGLGVGIYDAITNELNWANGALIVFSSGLIGAGIGYLIGGPLGAALGAAAGFIVGGAIAIGIDVIKNVEDSVGKVTGIISAAFLALGAILAFSGANIPLGIALLGIGAVSLAAQVAMNTDKLSDEIKGVIAIITAGVSEALLAVGAILAFSGVNIPLGIALIAGGALLMASAVVPKWDSLSSEIQGAINEIMTILGTAFLVLGAILAFSGANIPLGIGLMVAGATSLGTVAALNWDAIVEAVRGPIGSIMAIAGANALVIGLLLVLSGVGVPLGLGLILGGAASLGTAIAFNWDTIVNAVKDVWGKIKKFWDDHIAQVFTAKWWKDLGITIINGFISGIETGINSVIGAFESMINWVINGLNKISFEVPDWVPLIGGTKVGVDLSPVSFGRVSIPRFAEGGFPAQGQMFIANEAGPELVGNIGRRTAVANNEQIVESVSVGVAEANSEQNALLREQNTLLRAILEKDSGVYLDGRSLSDSVDKYKREQGRVLITGGVL